MKWIRFTLDTHTDAVDMLSYMLDEIGVEGIEIEDHLPLSEEDKKKMFVDILPDPDRKSTRLNSSHNRESRMPSSA